MLEPIQTHYPQRVGHRPRDLARRTRRRPEALPIPRRGRARPDSSPRTRVEQRRRNENGGPIGRLAHVAEQHDVSSRPSPQIDDVATHRVRIAWDVRRNDDAVELTKRSNDLLTNPVAE